MDRLQKYLAACGVGSRRKCEGLIADGRVTVNGETVRRQGVQVDPGKDMVCVDGRRVQPDARIYLALNKPLGVVSTCRDPQGRKTVLDLLPEHAGLRLYPVGRLDTDSEGLLILTNDGEFANRVLHPRHEVAKTYLAWVRERLSPDQLRKMRAGVRSKGDDLRLLAISGGVEDGPGFRYEVRLGEGKNRHIRRMFGMVGARVVGLRRVAVGPVRLADLKPGESRRLTAAEVAALSGPSG